MNKIEAGRYDPPLSTINALAKGPRARSWRDCWNENREPLRRLLVSRLIVEAGPALATVIHPPTEKPLHAVQGASRRDALYVFGVTLRADVIGEIFPHRGNLSSGKRLKTPRARLEPRRGRGPKDPPPCQEESDGRT